MRMDRRAWGKEGEDRAVGFLLRKGYRILERNFRFERGEIDIVAEDGETLVFVEVKARRSKSFGEAEEAISVHKRKQLRRVAEGYLFKNSIDGKACRFDVIGVQYVGKETEIRHLVDAF
jgi:putative endonuclease